MSCAKNAVEQFLLKDDYEKWAKTGYEKSGYKWGEKMGKMGSKKMGYEKWVEKLGQNETPRRHSFFASQLQLIFCLAGYDNNAGNKPELHSDASSVVQMFRRENFYMSSEEIALLESCVLEAVTNSGAGEKASTLMEIDDVVVVVNSFPSRDQSGIGNMESRRTNAVIGGIGQSSLAWKIFESTFAVSSALGWAALGSYGGWKPVPVQKSRPKICGSPRDDTTHYVQSSANPYSSVADITLIVVLATLVAFLQLEVMTLNIVAVMVLAMMVRAVGMQFNQSVLTSGMMLNRQQTVSQRSGMQA